MNKTYQKHLLRWGTFGAGMLVFCFGVVLNTKTGLGVAAVNNVPYTISVIEGVSLGTATMMLYLVLVAAQCLLLRALPLKVMLQAPMSVLIGWIVDFFNNHILTFEAQGVLDGILLLCCAIPITAAGVIAMVNTDLIPAAPDGTVNTLSQVLGWDFGRTKYTFDLAMVALSAAYALVRAGYLVGIGLGTVLSALLVGRLCRIFGRVSAPWFARFMPQARSR